MSISVSDGIILPPSRFFVFSLCEIVQYQLLSRDFLPAPLGDLLVDGMACDKAVNLDGMGLPTTCIADVHFFTV